MDIRGYLCTLPPAGPVYYRPNVGNAGDALIACATYQLLRELGICYQNVDSATFDPSGKIVMYGGGGNLTDLYTDARDFVARYHQAAKKLIILPHTVLGHADLLQQLGSNVDIITRERTSYEYARANSPRANIFIMDDLAFGLDVPRALKPDPGYSCYWSHPQKHVKSVWQIALFKLKQLVKNPYDHHQQEGILNCFRLDQERAGMRIPLNNIDLALALSFGTDNEQEANYTSYRVLIFLNRYHEIRTDRLHLCIAGALLGKRVLFYPGNYPKCEAVYRFSMKDRFANVRWKGPSLSSA